MQKRMTRLDKVFWTAMFLFGLMIFVMPMVTELAGYQADESAYEEMALEIMMPEGSPGPIAPLLGKTEKPAEEEEFPKQEQAPTDKPSEALETTEMPAELPATPEPEIAPQTEAPIPEQTEPAVATAIPMDNPIVTIMPTQQPTATDAPTKKPPSMPTVQPTSAPQAGIDLKACLAQNNDFVAWINIPGTKINYPVVRSDNTDYYLHHLFSGKESKLGCLFSLKSSDYVTPSRNIAIYGHHLSQSDAMFSTLMDYKDSAWYKTHSLIRLETLYGSREYRIFAALNIHVSDWDAATASFSSDKAFLRFVNRAKEKAFYDTGVDVTADDSILTLITCDRSYGGASGRLLVMAVQQ